jgi:hypothetical protein
MVAAARGRAGGGNPPAFLDVAFFARAAYNASAGSATNALAAGREGVYLEFVAENIFAAIKTNNSRPRSGFPGLTSRQAGSGIASIEIIRAAQSLQSLTFIYNFLPAN